MTEKEARLRIEELTAQVHYYNEQYYLHDHSEISDYEFDQLLDELIRLEKEYPQFRSPDSPTQRVGGGITKTFETVRHTYPMLSLSNTYNPQELQEFDERVKKGLNGQPYTYFCELKFDGVAMSLRYENGSLARAVTRGDGEQGDNVTTNVKTIRTIPLKIDKPGLPDVFEVRGEVFMPREVFLQLNTSREEAGELPLANPRNTASGTIKMQDSSIVAKRRLDCYMYALLEEGDLFQTHAESIDALERWGFHVSPTYRECQSLEEVFAYIDEWEYKRLQLPLDTDGVVIKVNELDLQQQLGSTAKSPRWAIAYKYKAEQASTKLRSVSYQVGRTGAVTPVANLQPVTLSGTVVKRASLHNANEIERLDLHLNDTVFIEKGGEIIPKVTGVDEKARNRNARPVGFIHRCPECGTELVRKAGEAVHFCPNTRGCPPQIMGRISHFIQRGAMDIENIGEKTIRLLYEKGLVRDVADLYALSFNDIYQLEGFKELSTQNILDGIEESKQQPFDRVLFGLGIRYVGKTVAESLAHHFTSMTQLQQASYDDLIAVPEIGERIAESVIDYFNDPEHRELVERLRSSGLQMELKQDDLPQNDGILSGKTLVVSGVFSQFSRDELKNRIKALGGKVVSAVSGNVDYLVAGDNMGPAKREKAEKIGVRIISENEFIELTQ